MNENPIERIFGEIEEYKKAIEDAKEALKIAEEAAGDLPEDAWEELPDDPEDGADWIIIF